LQKFSTCPYQFLLSAIYRLEPSQDPEPLQKLDPLTRGALFHKVQAELFRALHTERLYENSPLARERLKLIDDQMDDFYEKYRPAKLAYYSNVTVIAQTAGAHRDYAEALMRQRQFTQAIEEEKKALALDPKFEDVYFNIGRYYEQAGQFHLAITNYLKQLDADPMDDRISLALGRVHYKLNEHTKALACLYRANKEYDRFENHLYLSQVLEALGRKDEADQEFQKGLQFGNKVDPSPVDATGRARR
jgi:tetratricopeptide (TPR) repeat protein